MRVLDGASDACAEADAVISTIYVVVNRLWNRNDFHSFIVQSLAVAERIVSANRNENVYSDMLEILENVLGDVVDVGIISSQMSRQPPFWQMTRPRSRGVKESSSSTTSAVYFCFC